MKRREFLRGVMPMAMAPLMLNGIPMRAVSRAFMPSFFSCGELKDRVLVIIQLHGGNDGLNTLVPLDQYSVYRNARPIVGIPDTGLRKYLTLDSSLPSNTQIGLHPDMTGIKSLYDEGKVRFIQSVGYPSMNGSHFRGTDIWLTGLDGDTMPNYPTSGWWGRYLDHRFQNYPDAYPNPDMQDPPGLEFGSHIVSLGFHREEGIPMGLAIGGDPNQLFAQTSAVGGALPTVFPDSDYGRELKFIADVERSTNVYAERLADCFNLGANTIGVNYPLTYHTTGGSNYHNQLSPQLKVVARLLSGGCQTKIFLVRMGGFDTHANQGIPDKPSFGGHSALIYHLSEAVRAFQNDLKGLGLEDRVLTLTFSEFGRQVGENSTWGTDHGTSAPMMLFGKGINPGVSGINPNLSNLSNNNIVGYQYDYRRVMTTMLQDWLGANNGTLDEVGFYGYHNQKLPLVNANYIDAQGNAVNYVADTACDDTPDLPTLPTRIDAGLEASLQIEVYPTPARETIQLAFDWTRLEPAEMALLDLRGRLLRKQALRLRSGRNEGLLDVSDLAPGAYLLRLTLQPGSLSGERQLFTRKVLVAR